MSNSASSARDSASLNAEQQRADAAEQREADLRDERDQIELELIAEGYENASEIHVEALLVMRHLESALSSHEQMPADVRKKITERIQRGSLRIKDATATPTVTDDEADAASLAIDAIMRDVMDDIVAVLETDLSPSERDAVIAHIVALGYGWMLPRAYQPKTEEELRAMDQEEREPEKPTEEINQALLEMAEKPEPNEFDPQRIYKLFQYYGRDVTTIDQALILLLMGERIMNIRRESVRTIEGYLDGTRKSEIKRLANDIRVNDSFFVSVEKDEIKGTPQFQNFSRACTREDVLPLLRDRIQKIRSSGDY